MSGLYERIAEIAGVDAACKLCETYGGRRIYIPQNLPADHRLARLLGFDAAVRLQCEFGYGHLDVPKGNPRPDVTTQRVAELTAAGMSANQIATELDVTARTVCNHRARARRAD